MRNDDGRDGGVTYIGPRALVTGFAVFCGVFLTIVYGITRFTGSLEAPVAQNAAIAIPVFPGARTAAPIVARIVPTRAPQPRPASSEPILPSKALVPAQLSKPPVTVLAPASEKARVSKPLSPRAAPVLRLTQTPLPKRLFSTTLARHAPLRRKSPAVSGVSAANGDSATVIVPFKSETRLLGPLKNGSLVPRSSLEPASKNQSLILISPAPVSKPASRFQSNP